ncbi:MAG: YbaK/EbsC family protein [Bryobacterales bacterium]|nr:YbaK/EbsC family protein [Bryobacterales bacterium]
MNTLDRIESVLQMRDCWYQHDTHPSAFTAREVALLDDVPQRSFAKTVVVHWEQGFSMAVLPADKRVDLEELRLDFGFHHLRLATEFELQELFPDCELGAMPPLGNGLLYDLPVYADGLLTAQEYIAFNAGTHCDVVRMKVDDWMALVRPNVLSFAKGAAAGR